MSPTVTYRSAGPAGGMVEMVAPMAGAVRNGAAGRTGGGGAWTGTTVIACAIGAAGSGDGVLVPVDLGPAALATRLADGEPAAFEHRGRVSTVQAPLVEGAVAGETPG